jgi:hypothetical protein
MIIKSAGVTVSPEALQWQYDELAARMAAIEERLESGG